jgi:chemotaxis protein CheD
MTQLAMGHYTVGIADMRVVAQEDGTLITHALGSCLGITLFDPVAQVSGMVHVMLPLSNIDPAKATQKPCMFVDTGVPLMFEEMFRLGGRREHMVLKVAGGANIMDANDRFKIGQRNYQTLRKLLWKNNLLIEAEDVGGERSRTMILDMTTGQVTLRSNNESWDL